ncbi:MAG: hypothetical protein DPW09_32580 [Anaerolineae bacterium]|nr:hypothetical protein [Anaerolineae bacterium]
MRHLIGILFTLILASLLAACGTQASPLAPTPEPTSASGSTVTTSAPVATPEPATIVNTPTAETASASPAEAAPAPADIFSLSPSVTVVETAADHRLIAHALGQTSIPADPQRIVSLEDALTDSLLALDLTPIAATTYYGLESFSPHLAPGLAEAANIGQYGSPNLEAIVALKPDLILSDAWTAEENYELLAEIAPTVVFTDEYSYPLLRAVGRTLGKEAQAEARLQAYEQKAGAARAALEAAIGDQTVALLRVFEQELRIEGGIGYTGPVLWNALGLTPHAVVKMDKWNEMVSLELIPQLTTDILLLMPEIGGEARTKELLASPLWQQLPAVRNGKVYTLNGYNHWLTIGILANEYSMDNLLEVLAAGHGSATQATSTRLIQHAMGETEVPANPQRVVTLDMAELDTVLTLGLKPVGSVTIFGDGVFPDYLQNQTEGIEVVGVIASPNLEKIKALHPDLILGNKIRDEAIYPLLSEIAPTVFAEQLGAAWQDNFRLYAEALGKQAEAEQIMTAYEQRLANLRTQLGDRADRLEISMVRFIEGGTVRIYHRSSFIGVILDDAGLQRPVSQQLQDEVWTEVNKELIADMDGDVIFYGVYGPPEDSLLADYQADPLWAHLKAVQNGQVYPVPDDYWYTSVGFTAANRVIDDLEAYLLAE